MREPVHVAGRRRLLDPVEVVQLEPTDTVDRGRSVPRLVRVDPQQLSGPDRRAHGRDAGVVALGAAADLEVDHIVIGELARVGGQRLGVVALQEGEVVELLLHCAAEERARRHAERTAERVPARDLDPREDTPPRPDPRATDHPYPRAADYLEQADRLGGDYSGPGRKGQRDVRLIRHTDSVSQGVGAGGDAVGVVRGDQTREERPEVFARTRKPGEPCGVGLGSGHVLGDASLEL